MIEETGRTDASVELCRWEDVDEKLIFCPRRVVFPVPQDASTGSSQSDKEADGYAFLACSHWHPVA